MKRFVIVTVLAIAVSAFGVLLFGAAAKPEPISGDEFARSVRFLASSARELALLAEELRDDRVTASFARIHREKLAEGVADERDKLATTFPGRLAEDGERARELGRDLSTQLGELKLAFADRDALASIHDEASRIEAGLARIEGAR